MYFATFHIFRFPRAQLWTISIQILSPPLMLSNDHVARIPFPHLFGHDLTPFMSTKRNFEKHLLVL